jgi:hypothetical protein
MSSKTTRATRPRKPKATGPDLGNIWQPHNKREEAIIENVLEHAEEIRAARVRTVNRAIAISPHYSEEEKRSRTKPAPLTYEQIDSLARSIAVDLAEHVAAMPLMLLMDDISQHGNENAETIANVLNGYLFMWQPAGDAAEEVHVEQYRRRFLAGKLKGGNE